MQGYSPSAPQGDRRAVEDDANSLPCITLANQPLLRCRSKPHGSRRAMGTASALSLARCPHLALCPLSAPLVLLPREDSSAPPVHSCTCGYRRLWKRELVPASAGRGEVMSLLISQQLMPE